MLPYIINIHVHQRQPENWNDYRIVIEVYYEEQNLVTYLSHSSSIIEIHKIDSLDNI